MSDMTPVHSVEVGNSEADLLADLEARRKSGMLASEREVAAGKHAEAPETFNELPKEEYEALSATKKVKYLEELAAFKERDAARRIKEAEDRQKFASVHGLPNKPKGTPLPDLKTNNPTHPGVGVPYQLKGEHGEMRYSLDKDGNPMKDRPILREDF